jgi:hypothetical protein
VWLWQCKKIAAWNACMRRKSRSAVEAYYTPERVKLDTAPGASVEAAVAAANRATLSALVAGPRAAGHH